MDTFVLPLLRPRAPHVSPRELDCPGEAVEWLQTVAASAAMLHAVILRGD
jgi:hypothetical protein